MAKKSERVDGNGGFFWPFGSWHGIITEELAAFCLGVSVKIMPELLYYLLVIGAGFSLGLINALAGSGSAVTLPLLVFLGLSPSVANGTNRIPIVLGRIASLVAFQRAGVIDWPRALLLALPSLAGTLLGAYVASLVQAKAMGVIITVTVIGTLILVLTNTRTLLREESVSHLRLVWWHYPFFFLVGVWAGFIVLDSSVFFLLLLVLAVGYDLKEANAVKAVVAFLCIAVSLVIFVDTGEIDWHYGLLLTVGSLPGSWLGAVLATKEWVKVWVYRLLIIAISVEIYYLVDKYFLR
ncbi:MAG: sulfite exporter TauE/SafE family protein [Syntrophobacterales bacterium]